MIIMALIIVVIVVVVLLLLEPYEEWWRGKTPRRPDSRVTLQTGPEIKNGASKRLNCWIVEMVSQILRPQYSEVGLTTISNLVYSNDSRLLRLPQH